MYKFYPLFLQAPSIDEKVDLHFIALVNVDGILYELGKKAGSKTLHDVCWLTLVPFIHSVPLIP